MNHQLSKNLLKILACSYCGGKLEVIKSGAECLLCGQTYHYSDTGSLDLRLKKKKTFDLQFTLGTPYPTADTYKVEPLIFNEKQKVDFDNVNVPFHLTSEIMSYFPKAETTGSLMLDLGCGSTIHKGVCEHAGFEWVGVDYGSTEAPILGDAHALPFRSNSFEFVLSVAVLEHIRFPFVMMQEVYRVLKPSGIFLGTVAFLEPFHGNSFYHHTHLGTMNSLENGGFKINKLAPSRDWSVFEAQAQMALFPKMPEILLKILIMPAKILHKLWWKVGNFLSSTVNEDNRVNSTSGSFIFVATKSDL